MLLDAGHTRGDLAAGIGIIVVLLGLAVLLVLLILGRLRKDAADEEPAETP